MTAFLNRPSFELIIDLINVANTLTLNDTKVTFGTPTVLENDPDSLNTEIALNAISGSGYRGSVDVKYNRLDLALLFKNIAVNLDVDLSGIVSPTTTDLLTLLNSKYGLGLTAEDVVANPVDTTGAVPHAHTLVAADGSLAFTGSLALTIGPDPDVGEALDSVILTTNLSGLLYPNSDTTKAQAREYSWGVDASPIAAWLQVRTVGETIADEALSVELNKVVADTWVYNEAAADYNTAGAEVIYAGLNDGTMDTNQSYTRVVQFKLSDSLCANMGGVLTLGYN